MSTDIESTDPNTLIFHISQRSDTKNILANSHEIKKLVKYCSIKSLIMHCNKLCMLCLNYCDHTTCITLSENLMHGWIYCDTCKKNGILVKTIQNHINKEKIIPLYWLHQSNEKKIRNLQFDALLVKSKTKVDNVSLLHPILNFIKFSKTKKQLYTKLDFKYQEDEIKLQTISLANLFAHNPGLYEEMISCSDFLNKNDNDILLNFNNLCDDLKTEIRKSYELALSFINGKSLLEF